MTIRKAEVKDIPSLVQLWCEMMEYHAGMHPDFRVAENVKDVMYESYNSLLLDTSSAVFVAEVDGKAAGTLTAQIRRGLPYTATRESGYIKDVIVAEAYRGKGLGKNLAYEGIGFLKSKHVEYIDLIAGSANELSNNFWESLGFRETLKIRTLLITDETSGGN